MLRKIFRVVGSEKISRAWLEGETHCSGCGMKFTNIEKQVGQVRTVYPSRKREVICFDCLRSKTAAADSGS